MLVFSWVQHARNFESLNEAKGYCCTPGVIVAETAPLSGCRAHLGVEAERNAQAAVHSKPPTGQQSTAAVESMDRKLPVLPADSNKKARLLSGQDEKRPLAQIALAKHMQSAGIGGRTKPAMRCIHR